MRVRYLRQLVVRGTRKAEGSREVLAHEIPDRREHGHATVHDLRFAIALDLVEGDAVPGETKGVEVSGGRDDAGEAVTRTGVVGYPAVDGGYDGCRWLGDVGGGIVRRTEGGVRRRRGSSWRSECGDRGDGRREDGELHHF